ncbi:hypothetical protein A7E78_02535 [Syntrophotalea acetylenivorans]|uniref:Uncharacterized protein n=1 Tax=Syntrophotalea acetylenivorans TaxID=1842532 RepID=A0A1L3GLL0_9BACT|nr:hypothetical protein [Syntrophotalea acetylenivorans]APG26823.1 hypothetical protein A7E78_02535 [Syntrophotalea acetylenivorans]
MIRKSLLYTLAILLVAVPLAAEEMTSRLCTLTRAYECTADGECGELTIEEMALPRFVRIDLDKQTIVSLDKAVKRNDTKINLIKQLEEITVLQGVEQRGWSIALGKESGNLTLSAAGDGHGFMVFGACLDPR